MNVIEVFNSFQTQEQAVEHLEQTRWNGHPECPYCHSNKVSRNFSGDRAGRRWKCEKCRRAFAVSVGTIFHGTHMPLRSWFILLALMLNAKKSASSYKLARDLGIRRPTVWSMMHRVRMAMTSDADQAQLLRNIVKPDLTSTYFEIDPPVVRKRKFGYSCDKLSDSVQVVIAVQAVGGLVSTTPESTLANTSAKEGLKHRSWKTKRDGPLPHD